MNGLLQQMIIAPEKIHFWLIVPNRARVYIKISLK